MKQRSLLAAAAVLLLAGSLPLSASAFFWDKKEEAPALADFSKNGLVGDTIAFSPQDFAVESGTDAVLSHITLATLPEADFADGSQWTEVLYRTTFGRGFGMGLFLRRT